MMQRTMRYAMGPGFFLAVVALLGLVAGGAGAWGTGAGGGGAEPPQAQRENQYIGADRCKSCHQSEAAGNAFGHWEQSRHAKAFQTLATPEAKAAAKERGIEDPQKSDACLKCHVTAHGEPAGRIRRGFDPTQGVQCESCHGPGDAHLRARMRAAAMDPAGEDEYVVIPDDEIIKNPGVETCLGCHNEENPTFEGFCFPLFVHKIRHLDPRRPRTDEEKRALEMVCGCGEECPCKDGCVDGCAVHPSEKEARKEAGEGAEQEGEKEKG